MTDPDCVFCKIAAGEINADVVYRTDRVVAFRDSNPQAPTHILIIPREHIATINDVGESNVDDMGRLFLAVKEIAKAEGVEESGYRVTMNCMEGAGQSVFHAHLHMLGGRSFGWPPG